MKLKPRSIEIAIVVITMIGLLSSLASSYRTKQILGKEVARLDDALRESVREAAYQKKLLTEARLGTSLLTRLALGKNYEEVFEFIRTIPSESLSCKTMELPQYSSVQVITFHRDRQNADGSILPTDECKSATILVKTRSLEIVDYNLHEGFSSFSVSSAEPFYVLNRELPDGANASYTILPTGFERIE